MSAGDAAQALVHFSTATETGLVAVITGGPGMGKSWLTNALVDQARATGTMPLWTRIRHDVSAPAFAAVRDFCEPLLLDTAAGDPLFHGPACWAAGVFDPAVYGCDAPAVSQPSYRVLFGLYWLLARRSMRQPILLVVDGIRGLDAASTTFLTFLVRRLDRVAVNLVVTCGPGELFESGSGFGKLAAAIAEQASVMIPLREMTRTQADAIVRSVCGDSLSDDALADCHRMTGGNPALLSSLARAIAGAPGRAPAHIVAEQATALSMPVRARLSALTPTASAIAEAVAVLGPAASVSRVLRLSGAQTNALNQLLHSGWLISEATLRLGWPILTDLLLGSIPHQRLTSLHLAAATILHDDGLDREALTHLEASGPTTDAWAVDLMLQAAATDLRHDHPERASRLARSLLVMPITEPARGHALLLLGAACAAVGDLHGAAEHLRVANGGGAGALPFLRAAYTALIAGEQFAMAEGVVDMFAVALPTDHPGRRHGEAWATGARLMETASAPAALDEIDRRAAEGVPGDPFLPLALCGAVWRGEASADVLAVAERLLPTGIHSAPDLRDDSGIRLATGLALLCYGRAPELLHHVDQWRRATDPNDRAAWHAIEMLQGWANLRIGRLPAALAGATVVLGETPRPAAARGLVPVLSLALMIEVLTETGRISEAETWLSETGADGYLPDFWYHIPLLLARARWQDALGRHRRALADLRECGRRAPHWQIDNPAVADWRSRSALLHLRLGDRGEAERLARAEVLAAERTDSPVTLAIALRRLGAVVAGTDGLALTNRAVELIADEQATLEEAKTRARWGVALRDNGRTTAGIAALREAAELAAACGATAVESRIGVLLHETASPDVPITPRSLTAAEKRTAEMAAGGLSNRDIAVRLGVGLRTVEVHLTAAYRKLGVAGRQGLRDRLASYGGRGGYA